MSASGKSRDNGGTADIPWQLSQPPPCASIRQPGKKSCRTRVGSINTNEPPPLQGDL
jgi:hypothetical protein